jgi:hypothetical protein
MILGYWIFYHICHNIIYSPYGYDISLWARGKQKMAGLKKPERCSCGSWDLHREYSPERWVCICGRIVSSRGEKSKTGICRVCGVLKSDGVPFNKHSNICRKCNTERHREYTKKHEERLKNHRKQRYQERKKEIQASVRRVIQSSPESFLRYLMHHITKYSRQKRVKRGNLSQQATLVEVCYEDLVNLYYDQNGRCALTGIIMTWEYNNLRTLSIDRIDSSKGYIPGNIQLVCQFINIAKKHYSNNECLDILKEIVTEPTKPEEHKRLPPRIVKTTKQLDEPLGISSDDEITIKYTHGEITFQSLMEHQCIVLTPWGISEEPGSCKSNDDIFEQHNTPSHGGWRISKLYFEKLPEEVKKQRRTFEYNGTFWFEEDSEWQILAKYLPGNGCEGEFDEKEVEELLKTGNSCFDTFGC